MFYNVQYCCTTCDLLTDRIIQSEIKLLQAVSVMEHWRVQQRQEPLWSLIRNGIDWQSERDFYSSNSNYIIYHTLVPEIFLQHTKNVMMFEKSIIEKYVVQSFPRFPEDSEVLRNNWIRNRLGPTSTVATSQNQKAGLFVLNFSFILGAEKQAGKIKSDTCGEAGIYWT